MNYFNKYLKYKKKYLLAKNRLIQKGGSYDFDRIVNIYRQIPDTGLYNSSLSLKKRINIFKIYCEYLKNKTKDNEEVIMSKRKKILEQQGLTESSEYIELIKRISDRGREFQDIGTDFETTLFIKINELFTRILGVDEKDLTIFRNPKLYYKEVSEETDTERWNLIGEIDAVVIQRKEDINYIVGICEMKSSFDDIPDGLFQIKRSFNTIQAKGLDNVKLNDIILDDTFRIDPSSNYYSIGYIFTSFDESQTYFNLQSKIRHYLINMVHLPYINYVKIFNNILKKQISYDKFFDRVVNRYAKDVLETIEEYRTSGFLDNIRII